MNKNLPVYYCIPKFLVYCLLILAFSSGIWATPNFPNGKTLDKFDTQNLQFGIEDPILITGLITDDQNEPLISVNVSVKGTEDGVFSDINGRYSITVKKGSILEFSYLGYQTQEALINESQTLDIKLVPESKVLDQVVVIGYGTSKKEDLTGSSVQIKGSEIANIPLMTATQALQGKVAGVQIINSGAPGSAPNIRIRGTGSILGGVEPLYLVDGTITSDIRNINTADILTMDILKDASSTAIYGARAANGVVIITTKAGGKSKFAISYDAQVSMRRLSNGIEMAGPGLYAEYSNAAADFPVVTAGNVTGSTKWYDAITRNAISNTHNLSINGRKGKYKYFISGGFLNDQGILVDNSFRRYTARLNHEYQITKGLKIGNTIGFSDYRSINKPFSTFSQAYIAAPIFNAKNPDGTFGNISSVINNVGNPLATIKNVNDQSYGHRIQGNAYLDYSFWKGFSFRTQFGLDLERNNGFAFTPEYYTYLADGQQGAQRNELADLRFNRDSIYQWVWDKYLNYETKIGKNQQLKITLGHTAERRDGWSNEALIENNNRLVNDENTWKLKFRDTALGQQNIRRPVENYFRRESYFARFNYKLLDRYLVNATIRRDANSNFPIQNRWATFPSIGLGWIVSNEEWFPQGKVFESIKLRGSFGIVGNDVIRPGQFDRRPTERLFSYFGSNRIDGAIVTGIIDPNLRWENVEEYDLGLEYSLLKGAIQGEIGYYNKTAKNALYTLAYPSLGFGTSFLTNAASIENSGLEFSIKWNHLINKNFSQNFGLNFTANRNNVTNVGLGRALNFGSLGNGFSATQSLEGQPIGSFWVYETNGVFQNEEEIRNYPNVVGTVPGDLRLVDKNGDNIIDNQDRVHVGSYQPSFFGGFSYGAKWKSWDFGFDVFANIGNKVYNAKKGLRFGSNYNVEQDVARDRWKPGSGNNTNPKASNVTPYPSDYFIEDGSFVRINNITLGKNFKLGKNSHVNGFRFYVSAQNPFLWTRYTGFTPELPGINANEGGIELNIYPISSAYVTGISIQLQ
jgi:TonB-dependent starch-binding outer membrane protein SusC